MNLCFEKNEIFNLEFFQPQLNVLANLFNVLINSGRDNVNCYDCGTVARGILYELLKEYRDSFYLTEDEINRIYEEYLY